MCNFVDVREVCSLNQGDNIAHRDVLRKESRLARAKIPFVGRNPHQLTSTICSSHLETTKNAGQKYSSIARL